MIEKQEDKVRKLPYAPFTVVWVASEHLGSRPKVAMIPLMPSPGRPKTASTPQSRNLRIRMPSGVVVMNLPFSAASFWTQIDYNECLKMRQTGHHLGRPKR